MTFARVMIFSLLTLLVFTGFSNLLPQVQGDPPVEEAIDTGSLDMAGMVLLGERLFSGKGTCTLCHKTGGRAPDLLKMDLAKILPERLSDPGYNGIAKGKTGAKAAEEYLLESLTHPSAFVVAGFGKKGSGGAISPMPKVDAAPIELSVLEMNAVTAFLQDKAGLVPTVILPSAEEASAASTGSEDTEEEGPATTGAAAIEKYGCATCHDLEGSQADIGPKMNGIGKKMSDAKLVEAIIQPDLEITQGYESEIMPDDFAEQMRVSELNLIVEYLKKLPE